MLSRVELIRAFVGCLLFALPASSWYLPGLVPIEYGEGALMDLQVNKLTSVETQLPYSYYSLPYCMPASVRSKVENLGEILQGDVIQNSDYKIRMMLNTSFTLLCIRKLSMLEKDRFRSRIEDGYMVNFMLDGLPATTLQRTVSGQFLYSQGFPVGRIENGKYYVHNHLQMSLFYHTDPQFYEGARLVGFEIEPHSVGNELARHRLDRISRTEEEKGRQYGDIEELQKSENVLPIRESSTRRSEIESAQRYHISRRAAAQDTRFGGWSYRPFDLDQADEILFTYEVVWYSSPIRWAARWDNFLKMTAGRVHWFSILNSMVIALFCLSIVAAILIRTLRGSITLHNAQELSGDRRWRWTVLGPDVFRRPRCARLLAVSVGSGMQVLATTLATLTLALHGFVPPSFRGGLLLSTLWFYCFTGVIAGYVSSRLFRAMGGEEDWRRTAAWAATAYPGICFVIFFALNLLNFSQKASSTVPLLTIVGILALWCFVLVPCACLGSYMGVCRHAVKTSPTTRPEPRRIPKQPWYRSLVVSMIVGGIIPFSITFTELFFVLASIWQHQCYALFGFFALMVGLFTITSVEVAIIMTYFQLNAEDYHWWWRSFLSTASSGVYVFLYSIYFFHARLNITLAASAVLYFGYMLLISCVFSLVGGACGMIASHMFVRAIYGSIHAREVDLCGPGEVEDIPSTGDLELRQNDMNTPRFEAAMVPAEGASTAAEEPAVTQLTEQSSTAAQQDDAAASLDRKAEGSAAQQDDVAASLDRKAEG